MDLAISITPETAAELIEILDRLGFDHNCRTLTDVLQTLCIYAIDQKNAVRVDLWTKPKGLILDKESLERRKRIKPEGWPEMWLVSAEDLIIMKLAAHRPRDIEQIQTILIRRRKEIDWKYLEKRAEQHNVQPELTEIQAKLKLIKQ